MKKKDEKTFCKICGKKNPVVCNSIYLLTARNEGLCGVCYAYRRKKNSASENSKKQLSIFDAQKQKEFFLKRKGQTQG